VCQSFATNDGAASNHGDCSGGDYAGRVERHALPHGHPRPHALSGSLLPRLYGCQGGTELICDLFNKVSQQPSSYGADISALYVLVSSGEESWSRTHPLSAYWHTRTSCSEWVFLLERKERHSTAIGVLFLGRFSMASVRLRRSDLSAS
jgi:hypothetical protein